MHSLSRHQPLPDASLAALGAACPLPFVAVDQDGVLCAWNAAAGDLLGMAPASGRIENAALELLLGRALAGNAVHDEQLVWVREDGDELELYASAAPFGEGAVCFALPLVEPPAQVENALAAARIAHELNNVMTAISGYAHLLLDDAGPGASGRRSAERIADAAARGVAISQHLGSLVRRATVRSGSR